MIGQTKFYNNRPVTILKQEGYGFVFVVAELNLSHDVTGANWCTMCMAGGEFIASHTCELAQDVIDDLMDNVEDHEVFWVSERYLNDVPFEFKPYKALVDKIEVLKQDHIFIDSKIKESKNTVSALDADIESKTSELSDIQLKIQQAQHDLMSATNEEPHQKLPDILTSSSFDISTKEMLDLIECRMRLNALQNVGIDNWEWYSESLGDTDFESEAIIELSSKIKK